MGFFDRLLGRTSPPTPLPPEELQERLFEAVHSSDSERLAQLCAEHEAVILDSFSSWMKVPQDIRGEPEHLQRYVQGLLGIARCLAKTRNQPEPLQRMMGPPAENPLTRGQETLGRAQALMEGLDFEGAQELLTAEADRLQGVSGGSAETLKAMAAGKLAACHFQMGRAEAALPLFQQALELCWKAGDQDGVIVSLESLFEVYRYLGQGRVAARVASEFAAALERAGQQARARRIRTVARIVQEGEPLNRVVADLDGDTFELDELPISSPPHLHFHFCRNRMELARPKALVEQGRELVRAGQYEEALALFTEAGRLDPHAPDPRYNGALTLLHLRRADEAVEWYDEVETLAPGWFHCRSDRWLAAGIAAGRISLQAFDFLQALDNPGLDAPARLQLTRQAIRTAPQVPELKLHLARQLVAGDRRSAEAWQMFATALQQAKEPDLRSRLLVEAASLLPPSKERERMLHEAMDARGNLVAAATARVMLRMAPDHG